MPSHSHQKRKKRQDHSHRTDSPDFFTVSKKALIGGASTLGSALLLSLAASALSLLAPDPASLTLPIGLAIFFISAAIGGAVSAAGFKGHPQIATITAVFCGFLFVIVSGICAVWQSIAAPDSSHGIPLLLSVILRLMAVPTSALAAYFVSKERNKPRRRKR